MEGINDECSINIFYFNSGTQPSSCGYCKKDGAKSKSSFSFGFSSDRLSPELYENLMFLGWRRCGDYVYRPNLEKSCCKLYSSRVNIERFKINKNQKRVMKNFRRYLIGERLKKDNNLEENVDMISTDKLQDKFESQIIETLKNFSYSKLFLEIVNQNSDIMPAVNAIRNKKTNMGDYSSNFLITTYYNLIRKDVEALKFKDQNEFYKSAAEIFIRYVEENKPDFLNYWKIVISEKTGHLNFFIKEEKKAEMLLYHDNFNKILKEKIDKNKNTKKIENKITEESDEYKLEYLDEIIKEPKINKKDLKYRYSIELEPNSKYTEEKFLVYKKYQISIHKDKEEDLSQKRYVEAWGTSNLSNGKKFNLTNSQNSLHPLNSGTWDIIHRIDGRIFAVGVLDILPTSVSSVYLYYDPDFSFLNPGVFTAIREIELVKEFNKNLDNRFKYYVMGFYCHTCPKMKYKGEYSATEILCPVTLNFVDLEKVISLIKSNKYVKLSDEQIKEEMTVSKQEIDFMIKNFMLNYLGRKFYLADFVNKYVSEHALNILKDMEKLILLVGKENIRKFKFYVN